jgi:hypothetical protein
MTAGSRSWSQAVRYVPDENSTMLESTHMNKGRTRCIKNTYLNAPVDPTAIRCHEEKRLERLVAWERRASEGVP